MNKRKPDEQDEERVPKPDPRWVRILIAALPAVAAIAACVEQLARR